MIDYTLRYLPIAKQDLADAINLYRRINVGNYTVWYVVIDNVMEIRRIQPARRNEELFL